MEKKPFYFLALLFALLSCLLENILATFLIIGGLLAFSVFKAKNKDLSIKLIQPVLFTIVLASFKGIFNIVISSFYKFIWYACNGKTSFMNGLYSITYFTGLVADIALVVFVIIGIVAFSQGKDIKPFGKLSNKIYNIFAKNSTSNTIDN